MAKYHLQRELEKIKKKILSLGAMVEGRVYQASKLIELKNTDSVEQIINQDHEIDEMEVDIEEECLKILALYQPVAVDLRFIIAVIKINNDLERIGDEAVNIATRVKFIAKDKMNKHHFDYSEMVKKTQTMLKNSLESLINLDVDLAFKVCMMDDEVDAIHSHNYDRIEALMKNESDHIKCLLNLFLVSRHLERIADHATNIAEEVIYMVEGDIVRHGNY